MRDHIYEDRGDGKCKVCGGPRPGTEESTGVFTMTVVIVDRSKEEEKEEN